MLRFKIIDQFGITGNVWLNTNNLEGSSRLQWDKVIDYHVRTWLSSSYGYRGAFTETTNALDLYKVVRDSGLDFEILEGVNILEQEIAPVVDGRYY